MSYSSIGAVKTVAAREVKVAMRSKAIMISLAVIVLLIVGGVALASYFINKEDGSKDRVVTAGISTEFAAAYLDNTSYHVEERDTREAVEDAVRDGAEAGLVDTGTEYLIMSDSGLSTGMEAELRGLVTAVAHQKAMAQAGLTPEQVELVTAQPRVSSVELGEQPSDTDKDDSYYASLTTMLVGIFLVFYLVILFAGNVGGRITEEKASRVVEILLATVRPIDFLVGKILGNFLFGFVSSVVIVAVGIGAVGLSGIVEGLDVSLETLSVLIVMFVLGALFFGSLYAAAGALVSRSEDMYSSQMPILLLLFLLIYAPAFGMSALESTTMTVFTWLPPTSLTVAPLQFAVGNISGVELLCSWLILTCIVVLICVLAARIYRNAILHTGTRVSWFKALKSQQ